MSLAESPHERPRGGPGPNRGGWMTSALRAGLLSAIAAVCVLSGPPPSWGADDEAAGALLEAQEAYRRNVALGESLGGKPATAEQVAQAKRLFDDGLSKAVAAGQKKPMLIDFSTSRCGWCKRLDKEVLSNPQVVSFCRQLVCIKVDGDQRRDLAAAFGVRGYPTAIVLDHQGRRLHGIVGYRPTAAYLAELRRALSSQ
jgi:thiol:disulfide interchange protein